MLCQLERVVAASFIYLVFVLRAEFCLLCPFTWRFCFPRRSLLPFCRLITRIPELRLQPSLGVAVFLILALACSVSWLCVAISLALLLPV